MKMIKYFLIVLVTFMAFMLYIGIMNFISSFRTNSVMSDLIISVLFIDIQIYILGVYIRYKFYKNRLNYIFRHKKTASCRFFNQ
ncbi:MAG: hypothetical protein ACLR9T_05965 [Thomasclavelia sp.]|uniref:hypothetical protein n=1 Tax=Thomasclavelia sp. TaxID=3025757 RepID=UPI0039A3D954